MWQPSLKFPGPSLTNNCGADEINSIKTLDFTSVLETFFDHDENENPYLNTSYSAGYLDIQKINTILKSQSDPIILSINIQSLNSKHQNLCQFLSDLTKDSLCIVAVALQEIWRLPHPELLNINNFQLITKQRNLGQGGGVGFYVRDGYTVKIIKHLSPFIEKTCESLTIEIEICKKKYLLTSLYRSPSNNSEHTELFLNSFEEFLTKFTNEKRPIFIFTDSNINLLKIITCKSSQKYLEIIHSAGFSIYNRKATRIQKCNYSMIDHVLCKNEPNQTNSATVLCDISDHLMNFITFPAIKSKNPHQYTKSRDFSKKEHDCFL